MELPRLPIFLRLTCVRMSLLCRGPLTNPLPQASGLMSVSIKRWLAGDQMSIADFAAAAQLSCLDYIGDVDWSRNAALKDWYAKVKSRPAFRSILADLLPGFTPPEHYADLDF